MNSSISTSNSYNNASNKNVQVYGALLIKITLYVTHLLKIPTSVKSLCPNFTDLWQEKLNRDELVSFRVSN